MKTYIFRRNNLQNFGYFIATQCFSVSLRLMCMCVVLFARAIGSQVNSTFIWNARARVCVCVENIFLHTNAIKSE